MAWFHNTLFPREINGGGLYGRLSTGRPFPLPENSSKPACRHLGCRATFLPAGQRLTDSPAQCATLRPSRYRNPAHKPSDDATYVRCNAPTIANYAERHRYGERVSTAFAESTVNTVVGKRFTKRQQMRWSKPGAHLMLQTRTRVLDDTLRAKFQSWYSGLFNVHNPDHAEQDLAA